MLGLLVDRRQEDDWDALRLVAAADDMGDFIAVHARHIDVQKDDGELVLQQVPERLLARTRLDDVGDVLQHRADREQVALIVIDDEHPRAIRIGRAHGAEPRQFGR
jgi:hypothetical protein